MGWPVRREEKREGREQSARGGNAETLTLGMGGKGRRGEEEGRENSYGTVNALGMVEGENAEGWRGLGAR